MAVFVAVEIVRIPRTNVFEYEGNNDNVDLKLVNLPLFGSGRTCCLSNAESVISFHLFPSAGI